ncbi:MULTISPECIES: magnesium transporter [Peptoniphilus]|uniref:magnesium transporter n=1 Tax=Peptoniphilus TaxID=162289 RepID=UPI0007827298|nr:MULTISPECIES: magnesium transporter [Peptoniphilus]KXB71337.1 magnesium transporter [Peptoniphilus sp. DNF00840]
MNKLDRERLKILQDEINKMDPVDIAERLEDLSKEDTAIWIKLLNKDLLADAFSLLPREKKIEMIGSLSEERIISLMKELEEDEVVDTLQELPANMVRKFMNQYIEEDRRPIINELLGFPKDSVGSIMSVGFIFVKSTATPTQALEKIIHSDLDADRLEQVWVTNQSLVLIGYANLADLLRNKNKDIEEFMHPINASVYATDDQEVVAKLAVKYDLSEIPVTDSEGRLVGIVPAEWAIDVMHEEYEEDLGNIHGISESSPEHYWDKSVIKLAKDRTMWLIICLVTATFTSFIIKRYETLLASSVALAAYIPMLMDSGGNAGTQSSTTVIRGIYTGEIEFKEFAQVMFKELLIGIIVGAILVIVNIIRMSILDSVSIGVTLTVSITLLTTIVLSKIIGGILPLIAEKTHVDPTIMAGPLITTIVDTLVLFVYFEVATILLGV